MPGERTRHAALTQREPIFPRVPLPVKVDDAEAFPLIAEAIEHARKLKEQAR